MQINKNLYVELEIPALSLKNFLQPTDCYGLEIVETAGTSNPTALMIIKTTNEKVVNGINENNELIIRIGKSESDCESFYVQPVIVVPNKGPQDTFWTVEFGGFIGSKDYMVNQFSYAYENKTSIEVIKEVFPEDLNLLKTDIESVNEEPVTWRQTNQTMCQFFLDTILHMDIRPSFPLFGVTREAQLIIRDFERAVKGVNTTFVPYKARKSNQIQYINNFNVKSYKQAYDLFAGFNRNVQVTNATSGNISNVMNPNVPVVASTKVSEQAQAGSNNTLNQVQSPNVHSTYTESFIYNTNKLVSLSSYVGELLVPGMISTNDLAPSDVVYVVDGEGPVQSFTGLYVVDTISTSVNFSSGTVMTRVYVTRDNKNNVENYIRRKKSLKIKTKFLQELSNAVADIRVAYAQCRRIMDGTFLKEVLSFAIEAKNNILRSFSIAGVTVDFTNRANLLRSLILVGNSLMNTRVDMVFPIEIADVLRDFIIRKPTLIGLINDFISEWIPGELQPFIHKLMNSLFRVTNSLNSIAKDNGVIITDSAISTNAEGAVIDTTTDTSETDFIEESQGRVEEILSDYEDKTKGLDLPFPMLELTESQSLYTDKELENYVLTKTIENLTNLGYLNSDKDIQDLTEVLTGEKQIDFDLITRINANAGSNFSFRFWGTFGSTKEAMYAWKYEENVVYTKTEEITSKSRLYNSDYSPYAGIEFKVIETESNKYVITYNGEVTERAQDEDIISNALAELTSFYIKDSYKDKYRTVPCTKTVSATDNNRIFFACPKREKDLSFYINTKKVKLNYFEIDLGYTDYYGNPIMYNIYYTEVGYNSNSVLFEVKKGGMV